MNESCLGSAWPARSCFYMVGWCRPLVDSTAMHSVSKLLACMAAGCDLVRLPLRISTTTNISFYSLFNLDTWRCHFLFCLCLFCRCLKIIKRC
jgi:hypothetical protein